MNVVYRFILKLCYAINTDMILLSVLFSFLWSHLFLPSIIFCCWCGHSAFLLFSVCLPSSFILCSLVPACVLQIKRNCTTPLLNYIEILPTLIFYQFCFPPICCLQTGISVSGYAWNLNMCAMSSKVQCSLSHLEQSKELSVPPTPVTFLMAYTQLFDSSGFNFCLLNSH